MWKTKVIVSKDTTHLVSKKTKVLVCGATGFIGRNIVEALLLNQNYEVTATYHIRQPFYNKKIKWKKVNLLNVEEVESAINGIDIIIQSAAVTTGINQVFINPEVHVTDNVIMNSLIFRAAHKYKVKNLVFFSCTTILQNSETPLKEEDFNASLELYPKYFGSGWTKIYLEKMCEFFSRIGDTKFTIIRHSNVYGPWDKFDLINSHVFGATISKILSQNSEIEIWGTGREKRDLIYVGDLVDLVLVAIEKQNNGFEIYNAGGKDFLSISDLVMKIMNTAGKVLDIKYDLTKPATNFSVRLDSTKAKRDFGWTQKESLDSGIEKTINFWLKEKERLFK